MTGGGGGGVNRDKFCCILTTNGGHKEPMEREKFFHVLSSYKKVDSGGGWNNNIGRIISNKHAWLKEYKFNICFENSSNPGYLTEKLFDSFAAGCIPIYWGDTSLRCCLPEYKHVAMNHISIKKGMYHDEKINTRIPNIPRELIEYRLNPKSFINAHNFPTMQDLMNEVIRIDNDKEAYLSMLREPVFLDNFNPFTYYDEKLFNFLDNIVSQGRENAYRRGFGQFVKKHEKLVERSYKMADISHVPRNIFRDVKKFARNLFSLK